MTNRSDILAPLNLEKRSLEGVEFAAGIGRELPVRTTLLYVVELNIFPLDRSIYEEVCAEYLERLRSIAACAFDRLPFLRVRVGRPHEEILTEANECEAELIALAAPKASRLGWPFRRNTVERVVRSAPCLTLVLSDSWKINEADYRRKLPASFFLDRTAGITAPIPA
jgi:nucleotide-binding universal stress UspA family protein